ncbi:MAG TPA: DnaJ domain-containing protein, partial [Candidatus Limnocylindrales bacterium]|nr:DnaJ domain-containing protein [Candidatus Limnocylindrales bacterium]
MASRPALDPYAVLGVPRDASPLQVARARRRLAKRFHPDLHPGQDVSESMRRVNEAWHILSSGLRRADYDRAHPRAGTPSSGHWAPSRPEIRPMQPTTTRSWASWRTTAEETRAAPRTRRQPGEIPVVTTRRPPPISPPERTFRDSGWAAVLVALVFLLLLVAAVV